jgi:hypothetical protein
MSEHPTHQIDLDSYVFAKRDDIVGSQRAARTHQRTSVRPWPTSSLQSTRVRRALAA